MTTKKDEPTRPGMPNGLKAGKDVVSKLAQRNGGCKPEIPEELRTMTVMAASVLHLDTLVTEIQAERSALRRLTLAQTEILKAFSDLYLELTDESERRKFLARTVMRAEREAARLRLPLWFWRPEPELELKVQLYRRARLLLHEQRVILDDTFDLLREFCDQYARPEIPVTDEQLSRVIEYAHQKGGD